MQPTQIKSFLTIDKASNPHVDRRGGGLLAILYETCTKQGCIVQLGTFISRQCNLFQPTSRNKTSLVYLCRSSGVQRNCYRLSHRVRPGIDLFLDGTGISHCTVVFLDLNSDVLQTYSLKRIKKILKYIIMVQFVHANGNFIRMPVSAMTRSNRLIFFH